MKVLKQQRFLLILLAILIAFGIKAFLIPGLYTSHDGETHTARLANYYLALKEGQLPPQLAPTLFGGFGFPIFVFIYPLPYFLGAIIHSIGFSYTDSTELVMALGHLFSGLFFYLFLKSETKKTLPSFIGALFFTWAPYRFSLLFVRGAFAESFSYLFIASSLLCVSQLVTSTDRRWLGLTGLSLAGLLLSHQLTSVMFLPVILWYFLTKLIHLKHRQPAALKLVASIALAFAIAAFIYLPSFFERSDLRFDQLINYSLDHLVTVKQLIRSPWSYGFSHPGTINDDMSFQIGLTQLSAIAFSLATLAFAFLRSGKKLFKDHDLLNITLWLPPLAFSVFLMLEHPVVRWSWQHLPGLNYLDFPWRFLGVTITIIAIITTYLVSHWKNNFLLVSFLILFIFVANRNHLRINEPLLRDDNYFNNYPATATWRNEFLPKWRSTNKWEGIHGDYQVLVGQPKITENINKTHLLDLTIQSDLPSEFLIHRLYFPGWQLQVDGQVKEIGTDEFSISSGQDLKSDIDYSGFLKLKLPPDSHRVVVQFKPTQTRQLGLILSLVGLSAAVYLTLNTKTRHAKK